MTRPHIVCTHCVMDTTDTAISFDDKGVCDHCRDFEANVRPQWHTDERGRAKLEATIERIRKEGKGKEFDCILGLSGGLQSLGCVGQSGTCKLTPRTIRASQDCGYALDLARQTCDVRASLG